MEREENLRFCHRWRDPTVFLGERGEDSQRWLSDFQRVARYKKWDDSMCLGNVIFYPTGTAKCWFENLEEILNLWEEFKIKFCEIFGNKETARKAENILRTRAQTSGENVARARESYIQEILLLCKQSNPRMSGGEKVSHLIKGVAEEVYQALVGKDISTVDQFVAFCRRFEAIKRMRVAQPRFNRLPNVTTISTAEPENLETLIRIVREEVQKFIAPLSTFVAQDIDTPPPTYGMSSVVKSSRHWLLSLPLVSPRASALGVNISPRTIKVTDEEPKDHKIIKGLSSVLEMTDRSASTVGALATLHVIAETDAKLLGMPDLEEKQSISRICTGQDALIKLFCCCCCKLDGAPSGGVAATDENPPCRIAATMEKNWISVNIQGRNVQALADSGADYSVISEAFRRSIKAPVFKENGPLLRAADKKTIVTLGKCSLEVQIKGFDIIFYIVVAAECCHDVIPGWDFFKAADTIIDCGKNKLFKKNITNILALFYQLLNKDCRWNRTKEYRMLFKKCKSLLMDNGLGVILGHRNDRKEECPITFASRTLPEAEKRFSQLETKALSITFGVEKFRQYLLGRKFVLVTDNRPLIHIFSPHKPIPICASSRIKRWSLKLAAFNYTVEFRKTSDNSNIDALSRLPLESSVRESLDEDQIHHTAYHAQTNGLTERLNKTLTDMISMYVDVDQKNWDSILPYVTFAYNTARQETTGYSPFFLVHGREVETPLESILPYQPAGTAEDYVGHLVTNAEDARMLARLNILQAQSKDKERYDKKHQEVTYKEGDMVWVFTPVRTVGLSKKLLKRYLGPYRVIKKISRVNYQVEGVTNTRRRRKTQDIVHVVRMNPTTTRSPRTDCPGACERSKL
ncbi:K02A2.6-like, partial [Cordylochernes scorpioides]